MKRSKRRAVAATTMSEMMLTVLLSATLLLSSVVVILTCTRGFYNASQSGVLSRSTRQGMEELLYQVRSGNNVIGSATIGGTTYTSSNTCAVLAAPGYSPSQNSLVLSGVTDYIAIGYNSNAKTVYESVSTGNGSQRPSQSGHVIARNVTGFEVSYFVREWKSYTFSSSGSTISYTLSATPLATPTCYVNGVTTNVSWSSGKTVTISKPNASAVVQFSYQVSPTGGSGADIGYVSLVRLRMTCQNTSATNVTKTQTLTGIGRLRNNRK